MSTAATDTPYIEAQVTLSYRECLRFSWILLKESRAFWVCMIALMVIMRVQMLATSSPEDPAGPFWIDLVSWVLFIATMTPLSALFMWHRSRVFAPLHYRFDAGGLHAVSTRAELRQTWDKIDLLKRKQGLLLLYVAKRPVHCIPLHMLTREEADAIVRFARDGGVARIEVLQN